jgi:GNAT superfamily N-acetyltransferase
MLLSNFERMLQLAEDVFAVKNDPAQLDVDEAVIERLLQLHPASLAEYNDGNGPVAWVLLIPTLKALMDQFLTQAISEKELFELTPMHSEYDAVYLCSALVLEEYRRKGITKHLATEAINKIRKDHPIQSLFVWAFSAEGDLCAEVIANITKLPLYKRSQ